MPTAAIRLGHHVPPRARCAAFPGGPNRQTNLALSCPGCNLAKGERTTGEDHHGQAQALFNPRAFEPSALGWHLHFLLDRASGIIIPRTPMGEPTVRALRMNDGLRVFARKLQILARLIA